MNPDGDDLRSQFRQDLRRHPICRPMAAVDHDPQSLQSEMAGKGVLEKDNVSSHRIGNTERLADGRSCRSVEVRLSLENHLLHSRLDFVRQLEAVCGEKFYSVIWKRIVRSEERRVGKEGRSR